MESDAFKVVEGAKTQINEILELNKEEQVAKAVNEMMVDNIVKFESKVSTTLEMPNEIELQVNVD